MKKDGNKRGAISYLWQTVGALLLLVVLLPVALYIPWVQNIAKDYACDYASRETGLEISIDRILLKFPLDVSVDSLLVLDEQRDTMVRADNLTASVAVMPLLKLDVEVDRAQLTHGSYRMVAEDSSMVLSAHVQHCDIDGVSVDLNCNKVNLGRGTLRGGDIHLDYYPHKVVTECDTTESQPWTVRAYHLDLEDINYSMTMLPTIDNMQVHVASASLTDGIVDTGEKTVDVRSLAIDSTSVNYLYPADKFAADYAAAHPVPADTLCNPADTIPWTIKADSLSLSRSNAVYAMTGAKLVPGRGLNMQYIDVDDVNIAIDNFYNRGTDIALALTTLTLSETGSGLDLLEGKGDITFSNNLIALEKTRLRTLMSDINIDAHVDLSIADNVNTGYIQVSTDSKIALQDITHIMPELAPMLKTIPQVEPIALRGDISGNASRVDLGDFTVELPRYARATVTGTLNNPTDFDKMQGDINLDARFDNINFVKPTLLDKAMQKQVNFPPMTLSGTAHINRGSVAGDATMTVSGGKLVGKGSFNSHGNEYSVDATFNNFPVKAIAPLSGTDNLTATIHASGKGFDFLSPGTRINADVNLAGVNYNNALYRNLNASVSMNGGDLTAYITSANDNCRINLDVTGTVTGNHYLMDARGDIGDLDLAALGLYKGECRGKGSIVGYCDVDLDAKTYDVSVDVNGLDWTLDGDNFFADKAAATFVSNDQGTNFTFDNEDNHLTFSSASGLDTLIKRFNRSSDIAMGQYKNRSINIDTLQGALPQFNLSMQMGTDGLVQRYVQQRGIDWRQVELEVKNDSTIFIDGSVLGVSMDGTNIDTLTLHATQWNKYLAFNAHMGNRAGTMDEFAQVTLRGGIRGSTIDFLATQENIKHEMGYRVGVNATLTDASVDMHFFPHEPIIGYRKWTINDSNYVNLDYTTRMLDANLKLESDSSVVALTTQRAPGATTEDILLNIDNLRLEEWTKFLPNMDPMTGVLNADLDVKFDGHALDGTGVLDLKNFVYNGMPEGDFTVNTTFGLDPATGGTRLNADLLVDGSHVALAYGSLTDDKDSPLNLNMKLDRFPLRKVSAFIPGRLLLLRGYAQGELAVTGSTDSPRINGYVEGDSAYITLPRYGSSLRLCDDKLSINDNVINFDNYRIIGLNDNAVSINGKVDARDLDNMIIDLTAAGRNVQFIGSEQRGFSEIFGKAYADIDASVRSRYNNMLVRADLTLLTGSNITYVLQDEINSLTSQVDESMVTYVNLKDTVGGSDVLMTAAGTASSTNIMANITVQQGAKINAYLSTDGKDRATIDGSGTLKYSLDFAGKDALTGTYTIESGNFRYSPPLISQKNFDITAGSKVVWTGDMLNPQLDITATERVKTSVSTDGGGSTPVEFLVTASVGGTLGVIDLNFDLSTESDLTVSNELQSMSDVQRSQAAINLLLYNTYSGTNSAGSVNNLTASAALFSFVQSQLNSWASKTLKGVDLSFGINQYESSSGSGTETSYSYRLSKNLFNDRFKIVVGGEYSTDASAEENFANNLVSDISFEYSLNNTGSKYVRLFRHAATESILEGQVVETGVGFVMKRKVESLKSIFAGRSKLQLNLMDTLSTRKPEDEAVTDSTTTSNEE